MARVRYIKCTNDNFQSLEGLGISRLLAGGTNIYFVNCALSESVKIWHLQIRKKAFLKKKQTIEICLNVCIV